MEPELKNIKLLSFDCYGTLIDWRKGILETLIPLFDEYLLDISEEEVFDLFKKFDAELLHSSYISYRNLLQEIMKKYSAVLKINLLKSDTENLANSLNTWKPFDDTIYILKQLKKKYVLALVTNSDNDLIHNTINRLGVEFDYVITSEDLRSYKPSPNNFLKALERFNLPPDRIIHIAQSIFHDIVPCNELGIKNIWVNRYGEAEPNDAPEKPGIIVNSLDELLRLF